MNVNQDSKTIILYIQRYLKARYNIKKYIKNVNVEGLCLCYTLISAINKFIKMHKNLNKKNKNIFNELFTYIKKSYGEEMYNFLKCELVILYKIKNH